MLNILANNPITNIANTVPNFSNNNSDNYYSGSIRSYGDNLITNNNPAIPIQNGADFLNSFNPKNYSNNPNLAGKAIKNPSPVKVFSNYYLNNQDPNNIDNGYSRKKTFLMKDYYAKEKPDRDQFVK